MFKKIITTLLFLLLIININFVKAAENEPVYTKLRLVDRGTFNEYRYKIADEFFTLRNRYEVDGNIDTTSAAKILELAKGGYNYLPDTLSNKNYYNYLKTAVERAVKYPNNSSNYTSLVAAIENFLDKTNIQTIKGSVDAFPSEGNAPLNVTLRGNVVDPSGTKIPRYNYTWWMQENGKRKVLGNGVSLNYIFREEGNFAIFLDVKSDHKNKRGYTDVLPFSSRANIKVKEKIASIILKVNSISLKNKDILKFTPDDARYGLLFDATSSTPTAGTRFVETSWDFGNGITKKYSGGPKIERAIYAREGEYDVSLKLKTNELKTIERKFKISVHDPIATIEVSNSEGYLGDKFRFTAQKTGNNKNLSFAWEIIDLNNDKIIFRKSGSLFTYSFKNKGKYNVKMSVTDAAGKTDIDTKIIYINSRAPVADFKTKIPFPNKPNTVFFDATKSFDPDYSDDGKLKYSWIIDGNRVNLDEPNYNGSTGYFTFNSVGEHSVTLEVIDPDNISNIKKGKVSIKSILSVEFFAFPRVVQREKTIRFVAKSPEAKFFEWDFGDFVVKGGKDSKISHSYKKSGIFKVKLKVRDSNDNINTFTKNVYIGESDSPYAFIGISDSSLADVGFDDTACDGKGAYIVNRVDTVTFSGKESINVDGETFGLTYSWKLGRESYRDTADFTKKFDELGCFPIKLTVKSTENGKTNSMTSYVNVVNLKPTLSALDVRVVDPNTDPVIVNVDALGAKDRDGVIQSYLWYYYTDIDSEPQDFRATRDPSTSFVLPKVTGNYYFVVIMKDNNEARSNSEDINGSKYFMTLTGDNLNTPLVSLKVNDSSVSIGEEVIFTSNVENILGQDITKKAKYFWDFDGDGFYDKETTKNTVVHKFISSGEKHSKVKVKYKGFSNVKTVTVNVSNILKPDFGYFSIGNKVVFFYNGIGKADTYEWDLGDKTIIKNKQTFIHEYKDGAVSHIVSLKISEGTKVKSIKKKVLKNVKNRILARKKGLVVFSSPKVNSDNEIILKESGEDVFIYLGESKDNVINYVIDYDIEYDSDVNGADDDDEDNLGQNSYKNGTPIKVKLNKNKFQKIRLFIKDKDSNIIDSKDLTIVKEYIEGEKKIDINSIVFKGISDDTKLKIEKLKSYVDSLPKKDKLKASMYVQKLQEGWFDNREKTNVILEFEGYIDTLSITNGDEIINLLEGLLVEDQNDKSEKAITYNALKNLIPKEILCKDINTLKEIKCYDKLISKLDVIKSNNNIDENKALGKEILEVIANDKIMTNKEKLDFKAILKTFIYGGVANIPSEEKNEVLVDNNTSNSGDLINLIYRIFKWLGIIILVLFGIIFIFYIYFRLTNKDPNIGFQDFIIEKTSGEKKQVVKTVTSVEDDILSELSEDIGKKEEKKVEVKVDVKEEEKAEFNSLEEKKNSNFTSNSENNNFIPKVEKIENKKEEKVDKKEENKKEEDKQETKLDKIEDENIPEWLKGSFSEEVKEEAKAEIKSVSPHPNPLPSRGTEVPKVEGIELKEENKKEEKKKEEYKQEINKKEEKVEKIEDENIPEWLKGSFSEEVKEEAKAEIESVEESKKEEKVDKKEDENIPDWLKGSFSEEAKDEVKVETKLKSSNIKSIPKLEENKKEIKENNKKEEKKEELKDKNIQSPTKIEKQDNITKKTTRKKRTTINTTEKQKINTNKTNNKDIVKPKEEIKKDIISENNDLKENKKVVKKETQKKEVQNKEKKVVKKEESNTSNVDKKDGNELWDDGMKVPDWLKIDDEK